ncbi:MAG: family 43 glycosylhydrolase [Bacteriovoracia bacterium]
MFTLGLFLVSVLPAFADYGPCPGLAAYPVNENYEADPNGAYCLVRNRNGAKFNFRLPQDQGGTDWRIYMADPTLLKIADTYYVTGTSDPYHTGNFPIYKSKNLVDWSFHATVFTDSLRGGGHIVNFGPGKKYCNLWAPQLYRHPDDVHTVYLSFTATEDSGSGICLDPNSHKKNTVFGASITRNAFLSGAGFSAPVRYTYPHGTSQLTDGGYMAGHEIPVSGNNADVGSAPGQAFSVAGRLCLHVPGACRVWMALDSFVFFARPGHPNRQRMLYSWVNNSSSNTFYGNNIAQYPMSGHFEMDPNAEKPKALAYARNNTRPIGGVPNGCYGSQSPMGPAGGPYYCVAEGPAAFFQNGRYYIVYSRNGWNSPGYGLYYRFTRVGGSFDELEMNFSNANIQEHVLAESVNRVRPLGPAYGHGESFVGPGNKRYFIFHAKDDGSGKRTPFFKEMTFRPDGTIVPWDNRPAAPDRKASVLWFRIPRPQR